MAFGIGSSEGWNLAEESVDERKDETAEEAEYPRLSKRLRNIYILIALLPVVAFMGEIGYHTFRPIRTDYNPLFLEDQLPVLQKRIDEYRSAIPRWELNGFRNLENLSEAHETRINELNDLMTENKVALTAVHDINFDRGRKIRHEAAMQLVTAIEGYVELQHELLQAGYEGLETIEAELFWTECAERCRQDYRDWDGEAYCLRKLGPKGRAMVTGRAMQRRYRALRRSLLSIGPDFRLPFILPGD